MPEEIDFENGPKSSKKSLKSANFEEKSWKKILLDFFFGIHIPLMKYHFDILITVENRSWGGGVPLKWIKVSAAFDKIILRIHCGWQ